MFTSDANNCTDCGYTLDGLTHPVRCPECGVIEPRRYRPTPISPAAVWIARSYALLAFTTATVNVAQTQMGGIIPTTSTALWTLSILIGVLGIVVLALTWRRASIGARAIVQISTAAVGGSIILAIG